MGSKVISQSLMRLGESIRKQRQYKQLSQEELAEIAEISPNTVSRIEGGQTAMSVQIFQRLVQVLELDANQMLSEAERRDAMEETDKMEELFVRYRQLCNRDQRIVADTVETLIGGFEKENL